MHILQTGVLRTTQKQTVLLLWNLENPANLNYDFQGFEDYLRASAGQQHFLLLGETDVVAGWAFSFTRDHETWFAILVDEQFQGKGYGRLLLEKLKAANLQLNGWVDDHGSTKKSDGSFYLSPMEFYLKNGFIVCKDVRLELPFLSAVKIEWKSGD